MPADPSQTNVDPNLMAFAELLRSRIPGYPNRGALASFGAAIDVPSSTLGRYVRGEIRPTEPNLRRLAVGMGLPLEYVRAVLDGLPTPPEPPPASDTHRLMEILEEAREIVYKFNIQHAQSMRDLPQHRGRSKKGGELMHA